MNHLKATCLADIKNGLDQDNVIAELTSTFTSQWAHFVPFSRPIYAHVVSVSYDDVKEMQLTLLLDQFIQHPKTRSDLDAVLMYALQGRYTSTQQAIISRIVSLLSENLSRARGVSSPRTSLFPGESSSDPSDTSDD